MKKILFLFLVVIVVFSSECEPSWSEDVFVKVVDHYSRPLENATVQIYFQMDYGGIESEGIYGLANLTTGSDGMVVARLQNNQWYEPKLDCTYDIFVDYKGGREELRDVKVGKHGSIITFVFENAYLLTVKAMDENGNLIPAAIVVNDEEKNAENGIATFNVVEGQANITILYSGGQRSAEIWVDDDRTFEICVVYSNLTVTALDDANNGMECVFQLERMNYSFSKTLMIKIPKGTYYGKVICMGEERELDIDMTKQTEYFVVFDTRAPVVKNIYLDANGTILVIEAEDPGEKASGIAEIWVVYPGDKVRYSAFKEESGLYKVGLKEGATNFVVFLKDKEGNIRSAEGIVEISEKGGEEQEEEKGEDWSVFLTILLVVAVVLVGFLGKVIYEQAKKV
ncbi:MAG: hypothetical protein ACPL06_01435 [Candidatus Anstonellales archaeon]